MLAFEPEPQMILDGGFMRKLTKDTLKVPDAIKSDYVKVLYDVTHANTLEKGDPVRFLKALKGRVGLTHIADNDGWITPYFLSSNHLEFGKGNIDIQAVMKTLKQLARILSGCRWMSGRVRLFSKQLARIKASLRIF
jgi:sugar phosphate isomerase/epimerase